MQVYLQVKTSLCVEFSTRSHAYYGGLALYVCPSFDFCFLGNFFAFFIKVHCE